MSKAREALLLVLPTILETSDTARTAGGRRIDVDGREDVEIVAGDMSGISRPSRLKIGELGGTLNPGCSRRPLLLRVGSVAGWGVANRGLGRTGAGVDGIAEQSTKSKNTASTCRLRVVGDHERAESCVSRNQRVLVTHAKIITHCQSFPVRWCSTVSCCVARNLKLEQ